MSKEPDRSQRKALGKGLSALLPVRTRNPEPPSEAPRVAAPPAPVVEKTKNLPEHFEEFQSIPLNQIEPDGAQPREHFDQDKLEELAQSIRSLGLIQPITVRQAGPAKFSIIAGERRWRAARLAGLTEVPAFIRSVEKEETLELALIENIQREDLNPIEIALAFERLSLDYRLTHEQIAQKTGKDRSTVTNFLRLLKLVAPVREALVQGQITMGHARAMVNLPNPSQQEPTLQHIVNGQLSVRQTEALVRKLTQDGVPSDGVKASEKKEDTERRVDPNIRAAVDEMSMALGTRVRLVARSDKAGKLEVEYYSPDDLDRIYSVIVKQ